MSFWGITAFFNPLGSQTRVANLCDFAECARSQGLKLLVVELTNHGRSGLGAVGDKHITLRGGALCWQKERLLKVGLDNLPQDCTKVAWLDADILFDNYRWIYDAEVALERYPLVQLFESVYNEGQPQSGAVALRQRVSPAPGRTVRKISDGSFDCLTGKTGYAWAARRSMLAETGFYDRCIIGAGDAVMAWAAYGQIWPGEHYAPDVFSSEQLDDIREWARRFYSQVRGEVGFVPGAIHHLDHSSTEGRDYKNRPFILKRHDFSPAQDIREIGGVWHWDSPKYEMHQEIREYFIRRQD